MSVLLLLFFLLLQMISQTSAEPNSSEPKTFLIHSFSKIYGSLVYSKNLFNLFSNSSDGAMTKIVLTMKDDNLSMNVDTLSYQAIKTVSSKVVTKRLCRDFPATPSIFLLTVLLTTTAQAAIVLYGCDVSTLEKIKITFIENSTLDIEKLNVNTFAYEPSRCVV